MSNYYLAQMNIATMKEPLESPGMADFVANLDRINALAEASPGFVWRLQTEEGDATSVRPLGEDILINISVWKNQDLRKIVPARRAAEGSTSVRQGSTTTLERFCVSP